MKYDWSLDKIFKTKEEWEIAKEQILKDMDLFSNSFKKLFQSEEFFKETLNLKISLDLQIEKLYCYPKRFVDLNSEDNEHACMVKEAWKIYERILDLSEQYKKQLKKEKKYVSHFLQTFPYYQRYFSLFLQNMTYSFSSQLLFVQDCYRALTEKDMKFLDTHDENGNTISFNRKVYQDLLLCKDENVRREAMEHFYEGYQRINHTLALLLNKKYASEVEEAHKNFSSLLEQQVSLNELPCNVIPNLLQVANENLSIMNDYLELKKKVLKKDDFFLYDTFLPLGFVSKMEFSIEEGISFIKKSLSILGEDYLLRIDEAFQEGWIDVFPKENKRKMSFSCISYHGVPYASLNYNKTFKSVLTLCHELGHSIHSSYAKENNAFEYFEYSLFVSEIVSKVNELLLQNYLLKQDITKDEKIYLLSQIISSLGNTLFGQTMLTEFEHTLISSVEEKQALNASFINSCYESIYKKYNPGVLSSFDFSSGWSQIPHLFCNQAYYLYQYAIGLSLGIQIVKKLEDKEEYRKKYIEFLKIGNRLNVVDSLKILDIDFNDFSYLQNAYHYLEEQIFQLKNLLEEVPKKRKM